jgi:hypothetical protein
MLKRLLLGLLLSISISGVAVAGTCAGNVCANVYVTLVQVESNGTVYFGTDGDESAMSCTPIIGYLLQIPATVPGREQLLATLLTVQTSGAPILVALSPSGTCEVIWIQIPKSPPAG